MMQACSTFFFFFLLFSGFYLFISLEKSEYVKKIEFYKSVYM